MIVGVVTLELLAFEGWYLTITEELGKGFCQRNSDRRSWLQHVFLPLCTAANGITAELYSLMQQLTEHVQKLTVILVAFPITMAKSITSPKLLNPSGKTSGRILRVAAAATTACKRMSRSIMCCQCSHTPRANFTWVTSESTPSVTLWLVTIA